MSKKLLEQIRLLEMERGMEGRAALCAAVGKSERTLLRWLKVGVPTAHDAYRLALACRCTPEEARALASECFPEEAMTA